MPVEQANITLGTAGHIDHGKTALVRLLTGCETDRLKEEKERGMSIELGFAPCVIADMEVGIVDVPGHEHFVKTMVAGASGMDGVILVVAADDGVMPQTREHLDVLTLLGIEHGIVALTKIDRVGPDRLREARDEVEEFVQGTFLQGAPILPVSSVTGDGFERFYEALASLVQSVRPRRTDGVFRLPVERAFSVKGYGTVISGIPVAGSAETGQEIVLLPQGLAGRISATQVYGRASRTVMASQCAALNVRHWDHRTIKRGNTVTIAGYFQPERWYVCDLRLLRLPGLTLPNGARVKFHTGTSEVLAVVYLLRGDKVASDERCLVQMHLDAALVAGPGDRFVVRSLSPVLTVGGGTIVEAVSRRLKRSRPGIYEDLVERSSAVVRERDFAEYCLRKADTWALSADNLAHRVKVPVERMGVLLEEFISRGKAVKLDSGLYMHTATAVLIEERTLTVLRAFHESSPQSPGMTLSQLGESTGLDKAVLERVVTLLKEEGRVIEPNQRLALAEHRPSLSEGDRTLLASVESLFQARLFSTPTVEELIEEIRSGREATVKALNMLVEHGRLVRVAEKLYFHSDAVEHARELLASHIKREGRLESVKFKYLLDTTRKFAIPLLDYFDRIGVTVRVGNTRYLKSQGSAGGDEKTP